jgi:hypothetical protein
MSYDPRTRKGRHPVDRTPFCPVCLEPLTGEDVTADDGARVHAHCLDD